MDLAGQLTRGFAERMLDRCSAISRRQVNPELFSHYVREVSWWIWARLFE
jgi:hypothetical protein